MADSVAVVSARRTVSVLTFITESAEIRDAKDEMNEMVVVFMVVN